MLQRLNYYSRYHRIKNTKDIASLYHLLQGLNLDSTFSDDLILRVSQFQTLHKSKKNIEKQFASSLSSIQRDRKGSYTPIQIEDDIQEQVQEDIRAESLGKKLQRNAGKQQILIDSKYPRMQNIKLNSNKQRGNIIYENIEQDELDGIRNSIKSKNKTNNLSQMNCLQTQSIPDSAKYEQHKIDSPIKQIQNYGHEDENESNCKQIQLDGSQQNEQKNKNRVNIIYSNLDDQFSQDLEQQLKRCDEVRNSSYINQLKQQINSQDNNHVDTKSQKLYRLHGSDIEMDDDHQHQNRREVYIKIQRKPNPLINNQQNLNEVVHHQQFRQYKFNQDSGSQQDGDYYQYDETPTNQYACLDNEVSLNISNEILKIPQRGFTQGIWPSCGTQKSIQQPTKSPQEGQNHVTQANINQFVKPQNSNIIEKERKIFKKCIMYKKLNPRMTISTIVQEGPVKKVNFKKMIKKQSENRSKVEMSPSPAQSKKKKQQNSLQNKQLFKAFFQQN